MHKENKQTPEQIFQNFWKDIICNADGTINVEQVKKELADFHFVMEQVPKVYCHITGDLLSKVMYDAGSVIACADDRLNELIEEAKKDWEEDQKTKAEKWDALEEKIAEIYGHENNGEWVENEDDGADLGTIGEIAASAFGFL